MACELSVVEEQCILEYEINRLVLQRNAFAGMDMTANVPVSKNLKIIRIGGESGCGHQLHLLLSMQPSLIMLRVHHDENNASY